MYVAVTPKCWGATLCPNNEPAVASLVLPRFPRNARGSTSNRPKFLVFFGAAEGIRTPDPRITNALLYQLSYRGKPLKKVSFLVAAVLGSAVCYPFATHCRR